MSRCVNRGNLISPILTTMISRDLLLVVHRRLALRHRRSICALCRLHLFPHRYWTTDTTTRAKARWLPSFLSSTLKTSIKKTRTRSHSTTVVSNVLVSGLRWETYPFPFPSATTPTLCKKGKAKQPKSTLRNKSRG